MKTFVMAALMLFVALNHDTKANDSAVIREDAIFTSPDKEWSAQLFYNNDQYYLAVKDNKTGKTDRNAEVLSPLFSVKWTGDSKAIVTVEHLSGGSVAGWIHFNGKTWQHFNAFVPGAKGHYTVVGQKIGHSNASITYKGTNERENGFIESYYTCEIDINTESNSAKCVNKKSISQRAYEDLKDATD